ncbi:hypothetical protein KM043_007384 [Ampulex compressa]|nr:hypothetical protein KM043_007384 [Ampulex compressa]
MAKRRGIEGSALVSRVNVEEASSIGAKAKSSLLLTSEIRRSCATPSSTKYARIRKCRGQSVSSREAWQWRRTIEERSKIRGILVRFASSDTGILLFAIPVDEKKRTSKIRGLQSQRQGAENIWRGPLGERPGSRVTGRRGADSNRGPRSSATFLPEDGSASRGGKKGRARLAGSPREPV